MEENAPNSWARCLQSIQKKIQPQSFETWFTPISAKSLTPDEALLEVPNSFFADWLEEHYTWLIQATINEELSWKPRLTFAVRNAPAAPKEPARFTNTQTSEPVDQPPFPFPTTPAYPQASSTQPIFPLNSRYRFDNFVVGDSNEVSFSAAMAVAESPGETPFNPLVLYGGVGLGKTHLLQAIGDFCVKNQTAHNVVYVTAEKFFTDYLAGVSEKDSSGFTKTYRNADVLLVDDIQFYVKTEACQREFIHTFNALYQNEKQIVISSDRPPAYLEGFEDRLISRFQWGLVTDIEAPDLKTRVKILYRKAEELATNLSESVAHFLAEQIESNIRELEGALKRLLAFSKLRGLPISVDLARQTLLARPKIKVPAVSIEGIQKAAADFFQIPVDKLTGATRKKEVASARHVSMYLSKALTGAPLKTIGTQFGNRDHSTVIHACRTVKKKLAQDPRFEHLVTQLENQIRG